MGDSSKKYTPEFKQRAVELYRASGTSYAQVARELGCDPGSLAKWVRDAEGASADPEMNPFQLQEELRRLKRDYARLQMENEILLKASAFFASKQL